MNSGSAIILHHLHSTNGTPADVHRWHLARGWKGNGYNVMVMLDGSVWLCRGLYAVGGHTLNNNADSVGVGFQGKFDCTTRTMPDPQFNAGVLLLNDLRERFGDVPIFGHGEVMPSACPGRFFPLDELRRLECRGNNKIAVERRGFRIFGSNIEVEGILREGRTFAKIRPVVERMGYAVGWDDERKLVTID